MTPRNELQREIVDCLDEALRLQSRVIDVTEQAQQPGLPDHPVKDLPERFRGARVAAARGAMDGSQVA